MKALLVCGTILVLVLVTQGASGESQEDKLVGNLLERLKPTGSIARPASDSRDNVTVTLGLSLIRIASMKHNSAELAAWLKISWKDPRLAWDKSDYSGLSSVALPADLLWLPDIRPYTGTGYQPDKEVATRAVVSSDSKVIYVLPVRLQVNDCETMRNRSVACKFSLGSWVYNGDQMDIRLNGTEAFDVTYLVSDKWTVAVASAKRKEAVYPCCPEPYVSVDYRLILESKGRKSYKKKKSSKPKRKSH